MVDCSNRRSPPELADKYKVRYLPAILFVKPSGEVLETAEEREAHSLADHIERVAEGRVDSKVDLWGVVIGGACILLVVVAGIARLCGWPKKQAE